MISTKKNLKKITPIRNEKKSNKFFITIDVETNGLSPRPENFVIGCAYSDNFCYFFNSTERFKDFLINDDKTANSIIYAHNAEYDLSTIFGNIYENLDRQAIFNGKFIVAKRNGRVFADSLNLLPTSLGNIAYSIGEVKRKELVNRFKFGNMTFDECSYNECLYNFDDCRILHKALKLFFKENNCQKLTIASTALHYFRKNFLHKTIQVNEEIDNYFFESYYGGRVEAFQLGKTKSYKYDVNSLYPYVMRETQFPSPKHLQKKENISLSYFKFLLKWYEGCAKVKVKHKDTYFGYLPYRQKGKLCFPVGEFSGTWNFNELRFALKEKIIEIIDIEYVIYSTVTIESPFKEYVNNLYEKRLNTKDEFQKMVYKLLLNSLYGKFGQKTANDFIYFSDLTECNLYINEKNLIDYEIHILNEKQNCFLEIKKAGETMAHTVALFASYITSSARLVLLRNLVAIGSHNTITYCDTDSIFCETLLSMDFKELGQFKLEREIVTEIRGLKNYTQELKGEIFDKIKGVSKNCVRNLEGEYIHERYIKTRESFRLHLETGSKNFKKKKLSGLYDKRQIIDNRFTKPLIINE